MQISSFFLVMVGIPLLAFLLALMWIIAAKRGRDQETEEWQTNIEEQKTERARLIMIMICSGTKVVYGLVQAFFLLVTSGFFSGAAVSGFDLGVDPIVFCMVCAGANAVTALADGFLGAGALKKGTLATEQGFRMAFIKLGIVEFLAVLILLLSFLAILY